MTWLAVIPLTLVGIAVLIGAVPADEPWRPAFHFTPARNWMNDPNGLLYADGQYHLFFQHNPFGNNWGHMSWGHAVSKDLLHWQELPVALAEENGLAIFSGSAVVAGPGKLAAIYTGNGHGKQTQNVAFSTDGGGTWAKFANNPVLDLNSKDFRDPKVTRYRDRWVMVVALPTEHKVQFYESKDLLKWQHLSDFGPAGAVGGIWECPDLFELDDKWVLVVNLNPGGVAGGSGGQYFVGQFDGREFHPEGEPNAPKWIDYGRDMYATVSFFGTPRRRIWMGWMSNWQYAAAEPTTNFRTAQSLPRELRLRNGRIYQQPIRELEGLRTPRKDRGDTFELQAEMQPGTAIELRRSPDGTEATVLAVSAGKISLDRTRSGNVAFHKTFASVEKAPVDTTSPVRVRVFVDRSSIEVFANDGAVTITDRIFPGPQSTGLKTRGGVRNLRVWHLQ